jgi:hypothetical protein
MDTGYGYGKKGRRNRRRKKRGAASGSFHASPKAAGVRSQGRNGKRKSRRKTDGSLVCPRSEGGYPDRDRDLLFGREAVRSGS